MFTDKSESEHGL